MRESQAWQGCAVDMLPGGLPGVFQVKPGGRVITQGAVGRSDVTTGE